MNTMLLCILCISTSLIGLDLLALNRKLAKVLKPPESQLEPTGRRCPRCCAPTYSINWINHDGNLLVYSWCPDCGGHDTGHMGRMPSIKHFGANSK